MIVILKAFEQMLIAEATYLQSVSYKQLVQKIKECPEDAGCYELFERINPFLGKNTKSCVDLINDDNFRCILEMWNNLELRQAAGGGLI